MERIGFAVVMLCGSIAGSAEFAGGDGSVGNPYQIGTAHQLVAMGQDPNLLDKHYALINDIDLDPNLPGGRVFDRALIAPQVYVSSYRVAQGTPFSGSLDGRGYTVRNFVCRSETVNPGGAVGFCGVVDANGVISNVRLESVDMDVQGFDYIGGLVGFCAGRVVYCSVSGVLSASAGSRPEMGGLIGHHEGPLGQCYANTTLYHSGQALIGGLLGVFFTNNLELCDSYALGQIRCLTPVGIGGLVGKTFSGIKRCYAAVSIDTPPLPNSLAGPLIGLHWSTGDVTRCYYRRLSGREELDNGFGIPLSEERLQNAESFIGWGFYESNPSSRDSHWFMPATGFPVLAWQSEHTGLRVIPEVNGLTENHALSLLKNRVFGRVTFCREWHRSQPAGHALFTDPARYAPADSTIGLHVSRGPYNWDGNRGSGTLEDPYQIQDAGQLDALHARPDLWGCHFELQKDIDLKSRVYDNALLAYDEDIRDGEFQGTRFRGHLDGQGYTIRNLAIETTDYGIFLGLIGFAEVGAVIEDLCIEHGNITSGRGSVYIGLVAGYNRGGIVRCDIQGQIAVENRSHAIGGMVGFHTGYLSECQSECALLATADELGGLVGYNQGKIRSCRVVTHLYAPQFENIDAVGGLVGHNAGEINSSYVLGSMQFNSDRSNIGPLLGIQSEGGTRRIGMSGSGPDGLHIDRDFTWIDTLPARIRNCYAAVRIVNQEQGVRLSRDRLGGNILHCLWDRDIAAPGVSPIGIGLNTQNMQDPEILGLNGWAQDPNWVLDSGRDYPRLAWEETPGAIIPAPRLDWLEGNGTSAVPYRIYSEWVLRRIASAFLLWDKHFSLETDLDLGAEPWPVWAPNQWAGFSGTLDGNGHNIRNVTICTQRSGWYQIGLFGYLSKTAVIKDLVLTGCQMTSDYSLQDAGCLVGYNKGLLFNCSVSGRMTGGRYCKNIGLVAGLNEGSLFICRGEGDITNGEDAYGVGGCAGSNRGTVTHCQVQANLRVGPSSGSIGGLVGVNTEVISNALAKGMVTVNADSQDIGGLVGHNADAISHCYATATIHTHTHAQDVGALVGSSSGTVPYSYYLANETDETLINGIGIPLSDAEMRQQASFEAWDFLHEKANGMIDLWCMPDDGGYPELSMLRCVEGDPPSPALIHSAEDLTKLYYRPLGVFRLTDDIDLAGPLWTMAPLPVFAGTLDGNGYVFRNLSVVAHKRAAFFGCLVVGARVFDLGFEAASTGVAGVSEGVGILTAVNRGCVSRCYARGFARGHSYIGGLVGNNRGDINDCYTTVTLEGQKWSGGLVGLNNSDGILHRCYSNGTTSDAGNYGIVGSLVGTNYGIAYHCFWDKDLAPKWGGPVGRGLTTDQMRCSETYGLNGWAESTAWVLEEGQDYPRLRWEGSPGQTISLPVIDWLAGEGTEKNPYQIDTPEQLVRLGYAGILWDKHFVLTRDLDLTGYRLFPIGVCPGSGFQGRFDGQGHVIHNLKFDVDRALSYHIGLFGHIEVTGLVTDLRMTGTTIRFGSDAGRIGCLAGQNDGEVQRCGAKGTLIGHEGWRIGGLLGGNSGTVEECFAQVNLDIDTATQTGGLIGLSEGQINNAYANGRVYTGDASKWSGGLVGLFRGNLTNAYASCLVVGGEAVGALVGRSYSSSRISGCYFLAPLDGGGLDNRTSRHQNVGIPLSDTALRQSASFTGWDFQDTWSICEGMDYPHLQWEGRVCLE